jgi:hypothetical protein
VRTGVALRAGIFRPLNRYIATSLGRSLLGNRGLAAKDILLDVAGGCFRQLGLSATLNR